ncbi:MBL fold metallo-hydrolase [Synechocystis salina]|uniref:MBL fold metallo-hydrolase n=1 Tax=Synechocystis salina LEGE 00031 TaxID=1828736 RepID=A0ABR9VRI6_9SYNC|nr:MBL fold metallo-hydrolase [Synechocystis salina]MBE9240166.1 MBL fold metallo-hydrolase [Synechocystis salina LEGE 00041]MBE9253676.1 MBL fold metallo-hydrolase [Synechocystis salina LEGE 00031]
MQFRQLFDPETSTYTYVIADPHSQSAALVDSVLEQVDRDLRLLKELDLKLIFCLETHVHADHITGAGKLRQLTGCQNLVPQYADVDCADRHLQDGEIIHVGSIPIQAIATPGHTDSHLAFLVNQSYVLTGDALLIRGCGRTDFQSGDAGTLYDSIHSKLFTLPDDVLVYPGHDYRGQTVSTIGEEKRFNPRLLGRDRQEFIEFMDSLNLPDPQKIMEAVPANQLCGQRAVPL